MPEWLTSTLIQYPILTLFLAIGLGYLVGEIRDTPHSFRPHMHEEAFAWLEKWILTLTGDLRNPGTTAHTAGLPGALRCILDFPGTPEWQSRRPQEKGESMIQLRSSLSFGGRVSLTVAISILLLLGSATRSSAQTTFYGCKSVEVRTFAERVHVRCSQAAAGGIVFFAVATANSAHAARFLSVLMMAHLAGKSITVEYDPKDTSGTGFGCLANDCRRLLSVGVN
jgi:hypothetical protein